MQGVDLNGRCNLAPRSISQHPATEKLTANEARVQGLQSCGVGYWDRIRRELFLDISFDADRINALDVARPRPEGQAIQHMQCSEIIRNFRRSNHRHRRAYRSIRRRAAQVSGDSTAFRAVKPPCFVRVGCWTESRSYYPAAITLREGSRIFKSGIKHRVGKSCHTLVY